MVCQRMPGFALSRLPVTPFTPPISDCRPREGNDPLCLPTPLSPSCLCLIPVFVCFVPVHPLWLGICIAWSASECQKLHSAGCLPRSPFLSLLSCLCACFFTLVSFFLVCPLFPVNMLPPFVFLPGLNLFVCLIHSCCYLDLPALFVVLFSPPKFFPHL